MGCGNAREKIENEMIALKLERVGVQMERKNQIKLLEDIDGTKIKEPIIPDQLVLNPKDKNNEKVILTKNSEKRSRSKSYNIKNKSQTKNIKTNSTMSLDIRKNKIKMKKSSKKMI